MRKEIRGFHRWFLAVGLALATAVSAYAVCGDGFVDIGESCDQGLANGTVSSCCDSACAFVAAGTTCRAVASDCDAAETCTGASGACPADSASPALTVCRPQNGGCDAAETCDGVSFTCPVDVLASAGTVCRAPVHPVCDPAEVCDGIGNVCPVDVNLGDVDSDNACDPTDNCLTTPNASQTDSDGDTVGDACDNCTSGAEVVKGKIQIRRLQTPPGDDTIQVKGEVTIPTSPAINPLANGLRLQIVEVGGGTLIDQALPAGAYDVGLLFGWRVNKTNTNYKWRNKNLLNPVFHGIMEASLRLKPSVPGYVKFSLRGRNGDYTVGATDIPLYMAVNLNGTGIAMTGQCGEETFQNVPSGNPERCFFSANGFQLTCK